MLVKTIELKGKRLDYAVEEIQIAEMRERGERVKDWWLEERKISPTPYSTDWLWGGPLAEKEFMCVEYDSEWIYNPNEGDPDDLPDNGDRWFAWPASDTAMSAYGATELEAKMRALVLFKLGEEVDVPEELL